MATYLLDFESRSRADLKVVGGRRYWEHPSTQALCCAWYCVDTGDVGVWLPGDPRPFPEGSTLGAHNWSGFDRFGAIRLSWATPADIGIDTSELARKAGLPGALDALGQLYGFPKDKASSKFTKALSSVKRPKSISAADWRLLTKAQKRELGDLPVVTGDAMARVVGYCISDVQILACAWEDLAPWQDVDREVQVVDGIVNDRGVRFDRELAEALLFWDEQLSSAVVERCAKQLGWTPAQVREAARSNNQFTEITGLENARKATCKGVDHPLVIARQALATITGGKLIAGLARVSSDGRLRDSHRYYGAHTGRWAGRGMQIQNLPRPDDRFEKWTGEQIDALARAVINAEHVPDFEEIVLLLRATLCASEGKTLAVCDFSGIEARALAWAAGDAKALEVFRSGRNPYFVMAAKIFGVPYESITKGTSQYLVGKAAELACGYGMGWRKLYERDGDKLDAAGVRAQDVVKMWRGLHAPTVRFWRELENAFKLAIAGEASVVSCFEFSPGGRDVAVFLPSGRPIVYRNARLGSDGGIVCDGLHGPEHLYGGKLAENVIQAMCRDLMSAALVEAERAGLTPIMHVHDEIVCEVDESRGAEAYDRLKLLMSVPPPWAEGLPLGALGFVGRRYRK